MHEGRLLIFPLRVIETVPANARAGEHLLFTVTPGMLADPGGIPALSGEESEVFYALREHVEQLRHPRERPSRSASEGPHRRARPPAGGSRGSQNTDHVARARCPSPSFRGIQADRPRPTQARPSWLRHIPLDRRSPADKAATRTQGSPLGDL